MDKAKEEFIKYTNNYLNYGNMIELKINHTFRVMDLCEKIGKSLNLNDEELEIAKIIGLLHDIGRFEQWKNYSSFDDLKTTDHADLGVKILKDNNYLRKFIEDSKYDDIIYNSIKYHNKYIIPEDIDDKTMKFIKLIRDADKIDILYLYTINELVIEIDDKEFSNEIYNLLLERKQIDRKKINTKTDRLSVSLGFIYDIYYKYSYEYLKDSKYYDLIIDIYKNKTNNSKLLNQLENIRNNINSYIEECLYVR